MASVKLELRLVLTCEDDPYNSWEARDEAIIPWDIEEIVRTPLGTKYARIELGERGILMLAKAARARRAYKKGVRRG